MNLWVTLAVVGAMVALRWLKPGILGWAAAWLLAAWVLLRFGFETPIPSSVLKLYLGILAAAVLIYLSADADRLAEAKRPLVAFMTERRYTVPLMVVALAVPVAAALSIWRGMSAAPVVPSFGRTVHPAPPESITVHEQEFDLIRLDNPFRHLETTDPAAFAAHLERGREVYYENCFFCHGDTLRGEGMFAHALNPIPTNFQDPGTIPQLQESFLFWRIARGAPGLPPESGPWSSAMPAWESFLSEEEMWEVVLFLYDFTGSRPRARHEEIG